MPKSLPMTMLATWVVLLTTPVEAGPQTLPEPPTLEVVREGVSTRNSLFQNVSFRVVFQGRDHDVRGGPWRERLQVADGICDVVSRERADMLDLTTSPQELAANSRRQYHSLLTFTSESNQWLGSAIEDGTPMGRIQKFYRITWLYHPLELLGLPRFSPLEYLGDPRRASIEGMETIRGEEVVRVGVHWALAEYPGQSFGVTYWFNPSHGYALVRMEQVYQPAKNLPSKVTRRIDRMDFTQQGPLWLPGRAEILYFNYDEKGYEADRECSATFSNWSVNSKIPDSMFSIDFPNGTVMRDDIKDLNYTKGSLNDPAIRGQVARARSLGPGTVAKVQAPSDPGLLKQFQAVKRQDPNAERERWRWLIGILAALMAIGGIAIFGYTRRARGMAA